MTTLLHLGAAGRQLWARNRNGWQPLIGEPDTRQPVWVVTDLAEESLAEIETPRLYGRDRSDLIARQLAARFPDTPYRSALNFRHGGTLLDRIAPVRHTLFGLAAAEKLNSELDSLGVSVAALCPTTLLLTRFGEHKSLPADLFVVLPSPGALRIVFLKNRIPALTRLAAIPDQVAAQAEEIIRTHRYLENTRVLQRGAKPPPVLILGKAAEFAAPLAAARLELAPTPPPWNNKPPGDWRFPLFDLALREQPHGQLAPMERRTVHLANRLHKGAMATAAGCVLAGLAASGSNVLEIADIQYENIGAQANSQQLNAQLDDIEQRIATFSVPPKLVRRAVALNERELVTAPSIASHLQGIGGAINNATSFRLSSLDWRLLGENAKPCEKLLPPAAEADAAPAVEVEPAPAEAGAEGAGRKVELAFELTLPETVTPRGKVRVLHDISTRLGRIDGVSLLLDPEKELAKGTLRGGAVLAGEESRTFTWCLTLPGSEGKAQR